MHKLIHGIQYPKNVVHFCNFQVTAKIKQSLIVPKLAKSGHPARNQWRHAFVDSLLLTTKSGQSNFFPAYIFYRSIRSTTHSNLGLVALAAAWSSGIVSACHRGDWSYGS
jgi:hypothetical protein